jgi:hypothetical protein
MYDGVDGEGGEVGYVMERAGSIAFASMRTKGPGRHGYVCVDWHG